MALRRRGSSVRTPAGYATLDPGTTLFGRSEDVGNVANLLASGARLLTLTGTGGIGKTRVALQAMRELRGRKVFVENLIVSLAPVRSPSLVPATILSHFDTKSEQTHLKPLDTLRQTIAERRLLICLDNFEHLLPASPLLADLLGSCPNLFLLVTSRAPLPLRGQDRYEIEPLSIPLVTHTSVSDLRRCPSVLMFIDRAKNAIPGFSLTPENAASVAGICRKLAGIPLALELAAARLNEYSPGDLLAKLDRALPLLTGGTQDMDVRQRTLRAMIDWSYDLLTHEQKILFRRLGVFRGDADLGAIEVVSTRKPTPFQRAQQLLRGSPTTELIADDLSALVDHGLVRRWAGSSGEMRFGMLETIREYADERLHQGKDHRVTQEKHIDCFALRAARENPNMDRQHWSGQLDADLDNLREALTNAIHLRLGRQAGQLAVELVAYWLASSFQAEAQEYVLLTLACPGLPDRAAVLLRSAYALIARAHDDNDSARDFLKQNLAYSRKIRNRNMTIRTIHELVAATRMDDLPEARRLATEAREIAEEIGEPVEQARALTVLGTLALVEGDGDEAFALFDESLGISGNLGHTRSYFQTLQQMSLEAYGRIKAERLRSILREKVQVSTDFFEKGALVLELEHLALTHGSTETREGDTIVAELTGAAQGLREKYGLRQTPRQQGSAATARYVEQRMGQEFWEADRRRGRKLSLEDALLWGLTSWLDITDKKMKVGSSNTESNSTASVQNDKPQNDARDELDPHMWQKIAELTKRKCEYLDDAAAGLSNRESGENRHVSPRTVEDARSEICAKLGVPNTAAAVALYIRYRGTDSPNRHP